MKTVLTIAGSDCSGGAGIQADIKTITVHRMFATSVITALTAQNTTGITGVYEVSPQFVADQFTTLCSDIYPDAVKIGMVYNKAIILVLAEKLEEFKLSNVVLDPVMISTSGKKLLNEDAIHELLHRLIPYASVITPNLPEAERMSGIFIHNKDDMVKAAKIIAHDYPGAILIKGGHLTDSSDDLLYDKGECYWFKQDHIDNPNTHGTGCTLSSAIACNLAEGKDIRSSIASAKEYITGALMANLDLGKGNGPLKHCWNI